MFQLHLSGSRLSRFILGTLAVLGIAFLLALGSFLSVRPSQHSFTPAYIAIRSISANANLSDTEKSFSMQ